MVDTVATAPEALTQLGTDAYDVVISDLWLGTTSDGLALARAVKDGWPSVRFILATGRADELSAEERAEWGVDAVLRKPFTLTQLREAMSHLSEGQGGLCGPGAQR